MSHSEAVKRDDIVAPAMYSVPEFCRAHSISRSMLYKQIKAGRGSRLSKCGNRTLISEQAAAAWRAGLEKEAA